MKSYYIPTSAMRLWTETSFWNSLNIKGISIRHDNPLGKQASIKSKCLEYLDCQQLAKLSGLSKREILAHAFAKGIPVEVIDLPEPAQNQVHFSNDSQIESRIAAWRIFRSGEDPSVTTSSFINNREAFLHFLGHPDAEVRYGFKKYWLDFIADPSQDIGERAKIALHLNQGGIKVSTKPLLNELLEIRAKTEIGWLDLESAAKDVVPLGLDELEEFLGLIDEQIKPPARSLQMLAKAGHPAIAIICFLGPIISSFSSTAHREHLPLLQGILDNIISGRLDRITNTAAEAAYEEEANDHAELDTYRNLCGEIEQRLGEYSLSLLTNSLALLQNIYELKANLFEKAVPVVEQMFSLAAAAPLAAHRVRRLQFLAGCLKKMESAEQLEDLLRTTTKDNDDLQLIPPYRSPGFTSIGNWDRDFRLAWELIEKTTDGFWAHFQRHFTADRTADSLPDLADDIFETGVLEDIVTHLAHNLGHIGKGNRMRIQIKIKQILNCCWLEISAQDNGFGFSQGVEWSLTPGHTTVRGRTHPLTSRETGGNGFTTLEQQLEQSYLSRIRILTTRKEHKKPVSEHYLINSEYTFTLPGHRTRKRTGSSITLELELTGRQPIFSPDNMRRFVDRFYQRYNRLPTISEMELYYGLKRDDD